MANISDVIEKFILQTLGEDQALNLSRNDLATHFSCAPSQINYVLTTRFTPTRGFLIESRRGGGGYVRVMRLDLGQNEYVAHNVMSLIGDEISFKDASYVLSLLARANLISAKQQETAQILISDKAITNPFKLEDRLRASMLKTLIYNYLREGKYAL